MERSCSMKKDNFKGDFLDFFPASDSRFSNSCVSAKDCPMITNHTSMESSFIQMKNTVHLNFRKLTHVIFFLL